jgi:hypothetical protein
MGTRQPRTKGASLRWHTMQTAHGLGISLKFRDAGGTGSRHPSSLGARPRPASPRDRAAVRGRGAATEVKRARRLMNSLEGCGVGARARARGDCMHGYHRPTVPNQGEQDVASM